MKPIQIASKLIVALLVIFASACEKKDAAKNPAEQSNSFTIKMTDAPADYTALQVEIDRVEAYLEGSGWVQLSSQSQVVSVLDLTNGTSVIIAQQSGLSSGTYTALALYIGNDNTLVVDQNGNQVHVDLEGGERIELGINQSISEDSHAEVLLDFNVATSIVQSGTGDFYLNPDVSAVADAQTGVQGHLSSAISTVVMLQNQVGQTVYSAYTDASGNFLIRGVGAGTYDVIVQVHGVSGLELPGLPAQPIEIRIDNVTVVNGQITQMGTIQL